MRDPGRDEPTHARSQDCRAGSTGAGQFPEQPVPAAPAVSRRPATSPRRSRSSSRACATAWPTRRCSASPARARPTPWRTSSRGSAARRWSWRRTRRWRRSSTPRCASSSRRTRSSTSSPTTTTTSPRPTSRRATCSSRRTRASTSTSSRCGCRRPSRCSSAATPSSSRTVSAIYGIGDPVDYHGMILHLRESEKLPQRDVIQRLAAMQYERNELEFRRGTFRVRGDVIDIFPAENSETAVRVTLFDDEVESHPRCSIRSPATSCSACRASRSIRRATTSRRARPRCARSRRSRSSCASASSSSRSENKLVEAQRIEQRTRFDLEMLTELGFCKGIENYSRHLSGPQAGRAAADADRLPAARRADDHRREPRHHPAARRHVQGRPLAQGEPGRTTASACPRRWTTGRCASTSSRG